MSQPAFQRLYNRAMITGHECRRSLYDTHQLYRYRMVRRLVEAAPPTPAPTLVADDPAIRPMTQYTLEDFLR